MGVERYLSAATLRLSLAQRLVRRLCPYCRKKTTLTAEQARALKKPEAEGMAAFEAGACVYCAGRGYRGRVGLFEMLPIDEEFSRKIIQGGEEADFREMMKQRGMASLLDDAMEKVREGTTSLHEVLAAAAI